MLVMLGAMCLVMAAFTFVLCIPDGIVNLYSFSAFTPPPPRHSVEPTATAADGSLDTAPVDTAAVHGQ